MEPTWSRCPVHGHALLTTTDLDTGDEVRLRVPYEHRHHWLGWGSRPRVGWDVDGERRFGLRVSEGPSGITVMDDTGTMHPIPHGAFEELELAQTASSLGDVVPEDLEGAPLSMLERAERTLAKAIRWARVDLLKGMKLKAGQRWITVHPNGPEEKGVPVLIEPAGDGSHRIIAGAGGKLTHLRLHNVGTPEEHKEKAKEKAKEKRETEKARKESQTAEAREAEKVAKDDLKAKKMLAEREFVQRVRDKVGGVQEDLDESKLQGLSKGAQNLIITRHHKKQLRQALARRDELLEQVVTHEVTEAQDRAAIQRRLHEEQPEIAEEVSELADQELQLRRVEQEELRAERRQNRQRQTAGASDVGARAAEAVAEQLDEVPDPEAMIRALGGRDDVERPDGAEIRASLTPAQEVRRRALQALQDAKILRDAAEGETEGELAHQVVKEALERVGVAEGADEGKKRDALLREAARKVRRHEIQDMRAKKLHAMELADGEGKAAAALRFTDAIGGITRDAAEARRLGLTEADKTPLKEAEIADIYDLLADSKALRTAQKEIDEVAKAVEEGTPYDRTRRAFDLHVSPTVDRAVELSVQDEVKRELTERLLGLASRKRGAHLQAVANGHFASLADVGLGIAKERMLDRPTVDAVGLKNATVLMRYALEQSGHPPDAMLEALERHHVGSLEQITAGALAEADSYVPGLEEHVDGVDDLELALGKIDLHEDAINEAQRAVGAALGRMEATATLAQAFRDKLPDELTVPTGGDFNTALQWMHSIGLQRGDYHLDHETQAIRIPRTSWDSLLSRDPADVVTARRAAAGVKRGDLDQDGWMPEGLVSRAASTFNAPPRDAAPLAQPLELPTAEAPAAPAGPSPREQLLERLLGPEPPEVEQTMSMFGGPAAPNPAHGRYVELRDALLAGDRDRAMAAAGHLEGDPSERAMDVDAILSASHGAAAAVPAGDMGERMLESLRDHVGSRLADGEPPSRIQQDLLAPSITANLSSDQAGAYQEALDSLFPVKTDEKGRRQKFDDDREHYESIARDYMEKKHGTQAGAFHAQSIDVDHPDTQEAVYRMLSEHPEAKLAFKPHGELSSTERHQLRREFYKLAGVDPKERREQRSVSIEDTLGPEPPRENPNISMFGGPAGDNPDFVRYHKQRELLEQGSWKQALELFDHPGSKPGAADWERDGFHQIRDRFAAYDNDRQDAGNGTLWSQFVQAHGSLELATKAVQDELRGRALQTFRDHHSRTRDPLKLGIAGVTNSENHVRAMGTGAERREARRQRQREMAGVRERRGGQFAAMGGVGSAVEAHQRMLGSETVFGQLQSSLATARPSSKEPEPGQRYSLGERVEGQIGSLVNGQLGAGFEPGKRVDLFAAASMDGDRIHQQRVIRMLDHNGGRMGAWLGTGAGKSATSIGAFTHRHAQGKASHGLYVVPLAVLQQFGGEMGAFTKPGAYRWQTSDGMSHDERVAMLRDKQTHMRVMTHQAYRDTALQLMQEHHGLSRQEALQKLKTAGHAERAKMLGDAFKANGIPEHFVYWDEAHTATSRDGTDPSGMNLIMRATTHPSTATGGALLGTATPHKNDTSELYSMASTLDPEKYDDRHVFMQNYGQDLAHSPEAIRRELDHLTYSAMIPPQGVERRDSDNPRVVDDKKIAHNGPLELNPEHRKIVDQVHADYAAARKARGRGEVDVDAIRRLSPGGFEGLPEAEHEAHARKLQRSLGILRESAVRRAINRAPAKINTKLQAMADVVEHDLKHGTWTDSRTGETKTGRPSVVFSDSLEEAKLIHAHLQERGLRSALYHGGLNSKEREAIRTGFKPPAGRDPSHDVVVATSAAEAGINMQRAKAIHHFDVPLTEKSHNQRSGRAYRQGQRGDVDVHNWHTNTEYEDRARRRLRRKQGLASVFQGNLGNLDEHGVAAEYHRALSARHQARDVGLTG